METYVMMLIYISTVGAKKWSSCLSLCGEGPLLSERFKAFNYCYNHVIEGRSCEMKCQDTSPSTLSPTMSSSTTVPVISTTQNCGDKWDDCKQFADQGFCDTHAMFDVICCQTCKDYVGKSFVREKASPMKNSKMKMPKRKILKSAASQTDITSISLKENEKPTYEAIGSLKVTAIEEDEDEAFLPMASRTDKTNRFLRTNILTYPGEIGSLKVTAFETDEKNGELKSITVSGNEGITSLKLKLPNKDEATRLMKSLKERSLGSDKRANSPHKIPLPADKRTKYLKTNALPANETIQFLKTSALGNLTDRFMKNSVISLTENKNMVPFSSEQITSLTKDHTITSETITDNHVALEKAEIIPTLKTLKSITEEKNDIPDNDKAAVNQVTEHSKILSSARSTSSGSLMSKNKTSKVTNNTSKSTSPATLRVSTSSQQEITFSTTQRSTTVSAKKIRRISKSTSSELIDRTKRQQIEASLKSTKKRTSQEQNDIEIAKKIKTGSLFSPEEKPISTLSTRKIMTPESTSLAENISSFSHIEERARRRKLKSISTEPIESVGISNKLPRAAEETASPTIATLIENSVVESYKIRNEATRSDSTLMSATTIVTAITKSNSINSCTDSTRYCPVYSRSKLCDSEKHKKFMMKACCKTCRDALATIAPVRKKKTKRRKCFDNNRKASCRLIGQYEELCKINYYKVICCETCTRKRRRARRRS